MVINNGIIAEIFAMCQKLKDNKAFIDADSGFELSYKAFLESAIILSKNLPVEEGDLVAILLENNIRYFVIFLACLLKGAVVHLIDPKSSTYELKPIVTISKPKIIFTSNFSLEKAIELKQLLGFIQMIINVERSDMYNILNLDDFMEKADVDIEGFKIPVYDQSKVAFIVNSSGTTGASKCVMVNYQNMDFLLSYIRNPQFFDLSLEDCTISVCPFFHMYGVLISMFTLVTGMTAVVMVKFSINRYVDLIHKYGATVLFLVPPIATLLAKHSSAENFKLTTLRDIVCGAAPLGIEVQQVLKDRLNVKVRQIYGMSETTNFCTVIPLESVPGKVGSVGKLLPGCQIEIRHVETDEVLPVGQMGQLHIKGQMLTEGYWNNLPATKLIFDKNKFLISGDIGYFDEDGYIYVVDRLKEIIKYKAYQIAPAELEDLITSHPEVKESAVIGKADKYAGEVPMAFVVRLSENVKEEDIVKFVADNMKDEKRLHGGVQFIDEIPKNPSGKILRRKLREKLNQL